VKISVDRDKLPDGNDNALELVTRQVVEIEINNIVTEGQAEVLINTIASKVYKDQHNHGQVCTGDFQIM